MREPMDDQVDGCEQAALTPRQSAFVEEYLIDLNATQAAIRAGYSASSAGVEGPRLLGNHRVADAIALAKADRSERTNANADAVLERLWAIFFADPREIVTVVSDSCRFCHGDGHKYQFTEPEWQTVVEAFEDEVRRGVRDRIAGGRPNAKGGVGFDPRRPPNPSCPGCHGRGVLGIKIADTDSLAPSAMRLISGIKEGRHGIEIRLHDQVAVAKLLMQHLGLLSDRVQHDASEGFAEALEKGRLRALALKRGLGAASTVAQEM